MIEKVANAATYGGSGTAFYFGLSAGEWQAIGVIGGLAVAAVGLVVNVVITWHFKNKHFKLAEKQGRYQDE